MNTAIGYAGALALGTLIALSAPEAKADYVTLYSGTTAMTATGSWTDATFGFSVEYDLGNPGDTVMWRYTYSLTDSSSPRDISHIIVELTDAFVTGDISILDPGGKFDDGEIKTHTAQEGNPNLPSSFYGIKVNYGDPAPTSITFESNHAPMWGDLYYKDGRIPSPASFVTAYNTGFGTDAVPVEPTAEQWSVILAASDPTAAFFDLWAGASELGCTETSGNCKWALTPNSIVMTTPIPVPAALPILGAALAGFGFAGWRTHRKAD